MFWPFVILGMFVALMFGVLFFNQKRFNERWIELAAGSWLPSADEEEKPDRGFVAYSISYPKADLSDFWKDFWR